MGEWPLVGRGAELERVGAILAADRGGLVFAGPPGVGKTRLGTEALALAASTGMVTLRVTATQASASLPFGAFGALLPELAPGTDRSDRTDVLRQIAGAITARGEDRPVAVLVDDAHLLDDASAALALQLITNGDAFVVATVRLPEPAPDAVVALWKDGLAERIDVGPLGLDDVDSLLRSTLGGAIDGASVRLLWERTEGNALFLRELVLGAVEAGVLRHDGGLWRLQGELPATSRLVELVESRLQSLDDDERQALLVLALGEPLGIEVLERVTGEPLPEHLEDRGVVRVEEDGLRTNVRLGHPLYADVLRARLSPLRTRAISGSLADALAGVGAQRREDVLRLASWRLGAGDRQDPVLLLAGARQAHARHDLNLAERLARAAWEGGGGFDAGLLLAVVVSQGAGPEEAETIFAGLVDEAGNDYERAALAVRRTQNFMLLRRVDLALACAAEAEASIDDLSARAEVAAQHAPLLSFSGRTREARELAESLLPHAAGGALAVLCVVSSYGHSIGGRLAEALRVNDVGLATHLSLSEPLLWPPGLQRFIRIDALSLAGDLAEAESIATRWYAEAVGRGDTLDQAYLAGGLAKVFTRQGSVATGAEWARLSERLYREEGRPAERSYALVYLALALALMGCPSEAAEAMAEYDALPGAGGGEFGIEVVQARAWVVVAAGDLGPGRDLLAEGASMARSEDSLALESLVLHDAARLGPTRLVAERLSELAGSVEGPLARVRAAHAAALAAANAAGLEVASASFEDVGALLLAAEAAADAVVAWRQSGENRKASSAERRANDLVARCEGARTPALATAAGARAALTARELEIARLASAGMANKEIASRLYLSFRTVENKLHTVYEKLGVDKRADLEAALKGY